MHQPFDTRGDPVADQICQDADSVLAVEGDKEAEVVEAESAGDCLFTKCMW
jgi:hypothetical protein